MLYYFNPLLEDGIFTPVIPSVTRLSSWILIRWNPFLPFSPICPALLPIRLSKILITGICLYLVSKVYRFQSVFV